MNGRIKRNENRKERNAEMNYTTSTCLKARFHSLRPREWRQDTNNFSATAPPLSRLVAQLVAWTIASPAPRSPSRVEHWRLKRMCARDCCNQSSCSAMILLCVYSLCFVLCNCPGRQARATQVREARVEQMAV